MPAMILLTRSNSCHLQHQINRLVPCRSRLLHTQQQPPERKRIAVLGGGISGLTSAYRLSKQLPSSQYEIILLEKAPRLGGWIDSFKAPLPSSSSASSTALLEKGPRSIRPSGYSGLMMLQLLQSLNLIDRVLKVPKSAPSARNRFIYYPDRLAKLPNSLISLVTALIQLLFLRSTIPGILKEPFVSSRFTRPKSESAAEQQRIRNRQSLEDESIDSFISRRFGRGLAENLVSAVIHGIYAGDTRKLSIRSVMPFLWDAEREYGSVLRYLTSWSKNNNRYRSLPPHEVERKNQLKEKTELLEQHLGKQIIDQFKDVSVYSFPNGIYEIVNKLEQQLSSAPHVQVSQDASVSKLVFGQGERIKMTLANGDEILVDRVVSAIPAKQLGDMVPQLSAQQILGYNPAVNVGVVNLVIQPQTDARLLPVEGFGYLIPRSTNNNADGILGVVFDSDTIPTQDLSNSLLQQQESPDETGMEPSPVKLTVMMGGTHWSHLSDSQLPSQADLTDRAINAVHRHLNIPLSVLQDPSLTKTFPHMQRQCIPQYLVGHPVRMAALHTSIQNSPAIRDRLTLIGASYTGVSLNDCVAYATETADRIVKAELDSTSNKCVTGLERFEVPSNHSQKYDIPKEQQPSRNRSSPSTQIRMVNAAVQRFKAMIGSSKLTSTLSSPSPAVTPTLYDSRAFHSSARRLSASDKVSPLPFSTSSPSSSSSSTPSTSPPSPSTSSPLSSTITKSLSKSPSSPRKSLEAGLIESIKASGPMTVASYMRFCLLDPEQGYYASANDASGRHVLGSKGDFITSPEISQVFGELVAIFYIARWQSIGSPPRVRIVELGPGKGTLLSDMLRTFATFPSFRKAISSIQLVETSPGLMNLQKQAIEKVFASLNTQVVFGPFPSSSSSSSSADSVTETNESNNDDQNKIKVNWYSSVDVIPPTTTNEWTILTAHEFFDALPTHVFQRTMDGFREVLVGLEPNLILNPNSSSRLAMVLSPGPTPWSRILVDRDPRFSTVESGQRIEISPDIFQIAKTCYHHLLSKAGGIFLTIDYGDHHWFSSSLRAFKNHSQVDLFTTPGKSDLTMNVDFQYFSSAFPKNSSLGPISQADFLQHLGIHLRIQKLIQGKNSEKQKQIISAANRLIDPITMGKEYKVLAVVADDPTKLNSSNPSPPLYPFQME